MLREVQQVSLKLPAAIAAQITDFIERQVSGWIQLNFNSGELQTWQTHEHRRLK